MPCLPNPINQQIPLVFCASRYPPGGTQTSQITTQLMRGVFNGWTSTHRKKAQSQAARHTPRSYPEKGGDPRRRGKCLCAHCREIKDDSMPPSYSIRHARAMPATYLDDYRGLSILIHYSSSDTVILFLRALIGWIRRRRLAGVLRVLVQPSPAARCAAQDSPRTGAQAPVWPASQTR